MRCTLTKSPLRRRPLKGCTSLPKCAPKIEAVLLEHGGEKPGLQDVGLLVHRSRTRESKDMYLLSDSRREGRERQRTPLPCSQSPREARPTCTSTQGIAHDGFGRAFEQDVDGITRRLKPCHRRGSRCHPLRHERVRSTVIPTRPNVEVEAKKPRLADVLHQTPGRKEHARLCTNTHTSTRSTPTASTPDKATVVSLPRVATRNPHRLKHLLAPFLVNCHLVATDAREFDLLEVRVQAGKKVDEVDILHNDLEVERVLNEQRQVVREAHRAEQNELASCLV